MDDNSTNSESKSSSDWKIAVYEAWFPINVGIAIIGLPVGFITLIDVALRGPGGFQCPQSHPILGIILVYGPFIIALGSIIILPISRDFHKSLRHTEALILAFFPTIGFIMYLINNLLIPPGCR